MSGAKGDLVAAGDPLAALALLTRLPVRLPDGAGGRMGRAAWAWPLAGLVVAVIGWAVIGAATAVGLPPPLAAGLGLAALVMVTGALHEDGLADSADGLWGGADTARRLEIMKDSRIGSYGVIALVLSLGLRWQALALLVAAGAAGPALVAALMLSRAAMAETMAALPAARESGLSRLVGRPPRAAAVLASGLAALAALLALGGAGVVATLVALAVASGWAAVARSKIGGQTGDILGAGGQLVEIAALLVAVAAL
ncbi:adenosylcobinamide-GDP ribazoletransferase [Wenxinia marina]|uniref:Adenosylcobinamide-GDP ribazoletransferase n=1 Tax=Wenxinia marina DSM 24838 TaxID=1123501 RepID=A0A0D0Q3D0_9RHOB|nr:adenosylcobinamide-GDP ribazoletransferase [Wenxinia marina]KIQ69054.1 cobalamin-5'-phosphate synthase [Wenxinia marina DSM 24838]GGL69986.1 adenosylcobinamide-GDP ribazoletransferase [Wenxinia marina]